MCSIRNIFFCMNAEFSEPSARKKLTRRRSRDDSQQWRRAAQCLFLAMNLWIGVQFAIFVRSFELGKSVIHRPAGVEGWLPIAGMMNLKYFLATGHLPSIHPAAMFLLVAFFWMAILFRKTFCSWLCPVGTISEALWKLGRKLLGRNWRFPRWVDVPLRGLKYLLFGLFLYAVLGMSASSIETFFSSPYGLMADVKMLHFFLHLSRTAGITLGALIILSIFFQNFWCRYLCPYGALMGLAAICGPAKIRRDPNRCIDCARCARACPSLLDVDRLPQVRSAECTGCMECVAVCPAEGALQMSFLQKRRLSPKAIAAGLAIIFIVMIGIARWKAAWNGQIPNSAYERFMPTLDSLNHP
jgi:polyferredoxin